jgi:predicted amidohydrolase YtcJ
MTWTTPAVLRGTVVVRAVGGGLRTVESIGVRDGRVVAAGSRTDVADAMPAGSRVLDVGDRVVVPGLHDFHIHLVGLARARAGVDLDAATDRDDFLDRLRTAARTVSGTGAWVTGRGWSEWQVAAAGLDRMADALGGAPAFISSHDGHSAWASPAALALTRIRAESADPAGGRIERDAHGVPTGVLRETALDLVAAHVPRLQGTALRPHLDGVLRDLAQLGITGASEAGDYTDEGGIGADAELGDSFSTLTDLATLVDGRLRLSIGIPVDALPAAAVRGLTTGQSLGETRTLRFGWAKEYADGALGSGTAALFAPRSCGDGETGILRVTDEELDALFHRARSARIGLAIHAIGDRAVATVLDAAARAAPRASGVPADRMEHVQLARVDDQRRLASLMTASMQPIHAAADRDLVDACWDGRQDDAYAWRSVLAAGALLAFGSDAPVESVNPWRGVFAAAHRRFPEDARDDWRPDQALTVAEALAAYTTGPAAALGRPDEGILETGARADLAVLDAHLPTLLSADSGLSAVRSVLTLVDGEVVHEG